MTEEVNQIKPEYYKQKQSEFIPEKEEIVIFIGESPSVGKENDGKYFYDYALNKGKGDLFRALMDIAEIDSEIGTKKEGLDKFRERGYFLLDSTYEQINKCKPNSVRNSKIRGNRNNLIEEIKEISKNKKEIKIILFKKNVCEILKDIGREFQGDDRIEVLNEEDNIPFPNHWHVAKFRELTNKLLQDKQNI